MKILICGKMLWQKHDCGDAREILAERLGKRPRKRSSTGALPRRERFGRGLALVVDRIGNVAELNVKPIMLSWRIQKLATKAGIRAPSS